MRKRHSSGVVRPRAIVTMVLVCLAGSAVHAQISGGTDVNTSQKSGPDYECAIAKNPSDGSQLFAACNSAGGLFATRSEDGGLTWGYPDAVDKTIADGDTGQGPRACCDPTVAWDSFDNLYVGYLDSHSQTVVVLISTDAGLTYSTLKTFPGSVDQPTITVADIPDAESPVALWIVWSQSGSMRASGAAVTGIGAAGVGNFSTQMIPGTDDCTFGDVAIAPSGVVVQVCQVADGTDSSNVHGPSSILVNIDADGLGAGTFGAPTVVTATNVGMHDQITPQNGIYGVDAEAGLAYDRFPDNPHFGRLYLVYTEETELENHDTDIMLRYSDDDGATWSDPAIRVNDDDANQVKSQFLPRIASDPQSGNVMVCWHDARESDTNSAMKEYCSITYPDATIPVPSANVAIGDALSTSVPMSYDFGDYSGLVYSDAVAHAMWADTSNSTGDNPEGMAEFDAYTDRVSNGQPSAECEPCTPIIEIIWIILIFIIIVILVVIGIIRWLIKRKYLKW